jgi:hypothetical protein
MRYQHDFGRGNAQGRNATFTAESQDSQLRKFRLRPPGARGSSGGPFGLGLSGGGAGGADKLSTTSKRHTRAAAAQQAAARRRIAPSAFNSPKIGQRAWEFCLVSYFR